MVLLCDGQEGPTAADEEVIGWMRCVHSSKPVILAVNKCESTTQGELQAASFWNYGLEPLAVSAISGVGTGLMMERLVEVRTRASSRQILVCSIVGHTLRASTNQIRGILWRFHFGRLWGRSTIGLQTCTVCGSVWLLMAQRSPHLSCDWPCHAHPSDTRSRMIVPLDISRTTELM